MSQSRSFMDTTLTSSNHISFDSICPMKDAVRRSLALINLTADEYVKLKRTYHIKAFDDEIKDVFKNLLSMDHEITADYEAFNRHSATAHDRYIVMANDDELGEQDLPNPAKEANQLMSSSETRKRAIDKTKAYRDFSKLLSNSTGDHDENDDNDELIGEVSAETIPIDPYTNREIVNPVVNKICKHVYDRAGIEEYIRTAQRPKCPTIGCNNRKVSIDDIEDDWAMKARFEQIRHQSAI